MGKVLGTPAMEGFGRTLQAVGGGGLGLPHSEGHSPGTSAEVEPLACSLAQGPDEAFMCLGWWLSEMSVVTQGLSGWAESSACIL